VIVLQTNNTILYDRLQGRCVLLPGHKEWRTGAGTHPEGGVAWHRLHTRTRPGGRAPARPTPTLCPCRAYSEKKVSENVECEIMQVVLEEAHDSYK
jgi:hypothetical protein